MAIAKKTRKFATTKRLIGQRDSRLKENQEKQAKLQDSRSKAPDGELIREIPQAPSQMFFAHNTALAPPYPVLIDTNFLSHTIRCKLPLLETLMDTFLATVRPMITSCVMAELEKLGPKYRLALQIARDERWERLTCDHKGVYADDCIVDRCVKQRVYVVATNDKDLKRRIRKSKFDFLFFNNVVVSARSNLCFSPWCATRECGERKICCRTPTGHS